MSEQHSGQVAPIISTFRDDPDLADIVKMFVAEMPKRIEAIVASWEQQELETLKRLAHQLKGAGGGYGFESVSVQAGKLESTLEELGRGNGTNTNQQLRATYDGLLDLCRRVKAG